VIVESVGPSNVVYAVQSSYKVVAGYRPVLMWLRYGLELGLARIADAISPVLCIVLLFRGVIGEVWVEGRPE
jgi:hypothetical protein